ncbi:sulfotransferase 1 family member D1-like [Drosophila obscura]|uniref:sulfotransferase 1 family member D1-like n=1 Tax=Drosophila obscura TaxID=7282 RepID=UPI001BB184E0|nr:sulfotransferase 1 family member D1-like [Drosophila obscura]
MERERVTPKSYPTSLIDKDWTKRELFFRGNSQGYLDSVHDLELRDDDVWVVTLPKCGTTWMQELCWLLMNDCNFEAALAKDLELRSPFVEFNFFTHGDDGKQFAPVQDMASPRLIKSHLPLPLLPAQLWQRRHKVVYVFRNPLDALVSRYYHGVTFGHCYGKTLPQFIEENLATDATFREAIEHAHEFYQLRHEPWLYYTSFERMKKDLRAVVEDLCRFLDKPIADQPMDQLLKHLSFEEMKKNPTTNHLWELQQMTHKDAGKEKHNFVRRGKVNGYKDELPPEQIAKATDYVQRCLAEKAVTLEELLLLNDSKIPS